jgi:hypothetical protein
MERLHLSTTIDLPELVIPTDADGTLEDGGLERAEPKPELEAPWCVTVAAHSAGSGTGRIPRA